MSDYHLHLHRHGPYDGVGPPPGEYPPGHIEAYVEAAEANGAEEVGFTEHLFRCADAAHVLGPFWEWDDMEDLSEQAHAFFQEDLTLSLEAYVEAVVGAKDRGLPVLLGLEVDFFPQTIAAVVEHLAQYPFDFLIGSVHWIGAWSVDHGDVVYEFDRRGVDQAYRDYFELETALAASGAVDVLAHADVVKKFGHCPTESPAELYREVAKAAADSGTAVEVSSAGLHKPVGEMYPAPEFLAAFFDAGVPITLASDAHVPSEAGRDHDRVVMAAREAGYERRLRIEQRQRTAVELR